MKRQGSALRNFRPEVVLLEDRTVPSTFSTITENFNPNAIAAGDTLWFNSDMQVGGLPGGATTVNIHVTNQTINFTSGGQNYSIAVPDSDIVFTSGATMATATYDPSDNGWDVSAPTGGTGHVFMSGVELPLPNGLPGGVQNVTWTAAFWSDTQNIQVQWQWAAAAYSNLSSDLTQIGVKAVDDQHLTAYSNGDNAGSPEAYKGYVVAGGTGNGLPNAPGNTYIGGNGPNFNNTAIPAGDTLWFNANMQVGGLPPNTTTVNIFVTNQTITFTAGGQNYIIDVPDSDIVLTKGATTSSVSFDSVNDDWDITAPTDGTGHVFMGGVELPLPNGLPGGVQNVKWNATISSPPGVNVQWHWGAAAYSNLSSDLNALGVKPVDANNLSAYNNGDAAGSPESYKGFVVAGGTGNGAPNPPGNTFTGNAGPGQNVNPSFGDGVATYPYPSSNPLTSIAFNESTVLKWATLDTTNGFLDVWYSDEHALALGVGTVNVKTSSGTTTTNYAIAPLTSDPGHASNPALGTTASSGDQAGTDTSTRPMSPEMYITDITNNPNATSGDWQWGGQAYNPSDVFGTWKSFTRTVDYTAAGGPSISVLGGIDPAKNGWNLGAGADTVPTGLGNEGYGSEIRWNLNTLEQQGVLIPGHRYRFYVMVHDGDQNKVGGDAGQAAFNFSIPGAPPTAQLSGFVTNQMGGPGIEGVLITATEFDSSGKVVATFTTTTAADGSYSFSGLSAGTYSLSEDTTTLPVPDVALGSSAGTVDGAIDGLDSVHSTTTPTSLISSINLGAGNAGINYDFFAGPIGG